MIDGALASISPWMVCEPAVAWMNATLLLPTVPAFMSMLPPGAVNSINCSTPSDRMAAKLPLLKPFKLASYPTLGPLAEPPRNVIAPPPPT